MKLINDDNVGRELFEKSSLPTPLFQKLSNEFGKFFCGVREEGFRPPFVKGGGGRGRALVKRCLPLRFLPPKEKRLIDTVTPLSCTQINKGGITPPP